MCRHARQIPGLVKAQGIFRFCRVERGLGQRCLPYDRVGKAALVTTLSDDEGARSRRSARLAEYRCGGLAVFRTG